MKNVVSVPNWSLGHRTPSAGHKLKKFFKPVRFRGLGNRSKGQKRKESVFIVTRNAVSRT